MRVEIYWIAGVFRGRLAVLPRPRGGDWLEDEVKSLRQAGVDVLVCLLTSEEMAELDITEEADCCSANGIQFVSFPITDRGVPASGPEALSTVQRLASMLAEGRSVAIHCRQGVGRSALIAACLLASLGETPDAAFERIAQARGCPVPDTPEQREWVKRFVDSYLTDTRDWCRLPSPPGT
jgi:protein-tyrosine phosphatase